MGRPAASSSSRTTAHPVSGLRNVNRSMVPSTVTSRSVSALIGHGSRHGIALRWRFGMVSRPFPGSGSHARYARLTRAAIVVLPAGFVDPASPHFPTFLLMIRVQVRPNEPLEAALRRFKRQCNYAGIFRLAKKHAYHEKSSD